MNHIVWFFLLFKFSLLKIIFIYLFTITILLLPFLLGFYMTFFLKHDKDSEILATCLGEFWTHQLCLGFSILYPKKTKNTLMGLMIVWL